MEGADSVARHGRLARGRRSRGSAVSPRRAGGVHLSDESIIARYSVSASPNIADAGSGETVFSIAQPGTDHNGGTIAFSPVDGYLYLGLGDGGTGGL